MRRANNTGINTAISALLVVTDSSVCFMTMRIMMTFVIVTMKATVVVTDVVINIDMAMVVKLLI